MFQKNPRESAKEQSSSIKNSEARFLPLRGTEIALLHHRGLHRSMAKPPKMQRSGESFREAHEMPMRHEDTKTSRLVQQLIHRISSFHGFFKQSWMTNCG